MSIVRFLNGSLVQYPATTEEELVKQVEEDLQQPDHWIGLQRAEWGSYYHYDLLIPQMRRRMILNLTQGNYFEYQRQYYNDEGHTESLRELFQKNQITGLSHWDTEDKIVFVPDHLMDYTAAIYGKLHI